MSNPEHYQAKLEALCEEKAPVKDAYVALQQAMEGGDKPAVFWAQVELQTQLCKAGVAEREAGKMAGLLLARQETRGRGA